MGLASENARSNMNSVMFILTFATAAAATSPAPKPSGLPQKAVAAPLSANDLYARSARRRMASYLRMRLLELRKAQLERAAQVIEGKLPVEELLRTPKP
jgi:hypothetical protein